jgi:chemotaxis protein histidine kinase CheA
MSIRLDPRRLAALKLLAAEAGVRPGELVTHWVEERLDAARSGERPTVAAAAPSELAALNARIDELSRRVDALAVTGKASSDTPPPADVATPAVTAAAPAAAPPAKRRGRPPKGTSKPAGPKTPRIPLHDEIAAVIAERGPMTASELAAAITERGRYTTPRSAKPLDGTTVNARVSNPLYRPRFTRDKGRIGLANAE